MIEINPSNVSSGFEMLLEEVEAEIDFITCIGSRAFESRDFRKMDEAPTRAERVKDHSPHGTWEITTTGRARLEECKEA